MTPLEQTMAWLTFGLRGGDAAAAPDRVKAAGRLSPDAALAVYRRAYIARLMESLGETYGAVWRVLGDEGFFALARRYIEAETSTSYNLSDYGAGLPAFLAGAPESGDFPFLSDLARFEWLFREVFHAPAHLPLDPAKLSVLDSGNDIRLTFATSVRLFESERTVYGLWKHRDEPDYRWDPSAVSQPEWLLLCKQRGQVYCYALDAATHATITGMMQAGSLAAGLELAARKYADLDDVAVGRAMQVLLGAEALLDVVTSEKDQRI